MLGTLRHLGHWPLDIRQQQCPRFIRDAPPSPRRSSRPVTVGGLQATAREHSAAGGGQAVVSYSPTELAGETTKDKHRPPVTLNHGLCLSVFLSVPLSLSLCLSLCVVLHLSIKRHCPSDLRWWSAASCTSRQLCLTDRLSHFAPLHNECERHY